MNQDIGEYLKSKRKESGLTLKELEKQSSVSNSYISQIENGHFKPSPDVLNKLSKPLKLDFFELMVKAGYIDNDNKNEFLGMEFITKMVQNLSLDEKRDFFGDFFYNTDFKHLNRDEILEKRRKRIIEEINNKNEIGRFDEYELNTFLNSHFHLFASPGDYLKLLRIYRGFSIEELANKINMGVQEYKENEEKLNFESPLLTNRSEEIGTILEIGDLKKWILKHMIFGLKDKEGIISEMTKLGRNIAIQEISSRNKWGFIFELPMEQVSQRYEINSSENARKFFFDLENLFNLDHEFFINNRVLSSKEKTRALDVLKLIFVEEKG